jgi:hypothetical protein
MHPDPNDIVLTYPVVEQTAAEVATESAMDAHISGDAEKAEPLFNRATIEHQRSAAATEARVEPSWRDGSAPPNEPPAFSRMPPAPTAEAQVVSLAVNELTSLGAPGQALMTEWGGHDSKNFADNIGYARQAVQDIYKSDPGILEFLGREQVSDNGAKFRVGNDPKWVKLAAELGRLRAGVRNERPQQMTSNYRSETRPSYYRTISGDRQNLRKELDDIMEKTPPGSQKYSSPAVQRRLTEIHEALSGGGDIVGSSGRTS